MLILSCVVIAFAFAWIVSDAGRRGGGVLLAFWASVTTLALVWVVHAAGVPVNKVALLLYPQLLLAGRSFYRSWREAHRRLFHSTGRARA